MARYLVPIDGSPAALEALDVAIAAALAEPASDVQLVNVQPPLPMKETLFRFTADQVAVIREAPQEAGRALLASAEQRASEAKVAFAAHVRVGEPAPMIAAHATEYHCDAIVMGTRGMGLAGNLVLGSVAQKLIHLAERPITLVKHGAAATASARMRSVTPMRVLVPVDGSSHADNATRHAIELAKRRGTVELHVINVQPPIVSGEIRRFVTAQAIEDYHREEGTQAMRSARALLDASQLAYVSRIEAGHFAATIAEYATRHECAAIVMGTRGMGALASWLIGSTATKVIHAADVPVTLVK